MTAGPTTLWVVDASPRGAYEETPPLRGRGAQMFSHSLRRAAAVVFAAAWPAWAAGEVPVREAQQIFREAEAICAADSGRLWRRRVCGPMVLVDPSDRHAVANGPTPGDAFRPVGDVFVGTLPREVLLANTAVSWGGQRWTELMWPLPRDADARRVLLAHEMFHRVQEDLGFSLVEPANLHLDGSEARAWLQLEWRALDRALAAPGRRALRAAVADALAFRRARRQLHPQAAAQEHALEINEGLAAYTGVRLGLAGRTFRFSFARRELAAFAAAPSFVRTFAYATGPAYGLLLDEAAPGWRAGAADGRGLDDKLATALRLTDAGLPDPETRALAYGAAEIRAAERVRRERLESRLADLKAQLVDGPRLLLPTAGTSREFNPQTIVSLDPFGAVYADLKLSGAWGVLTVQGGAALIDGEAETAAVSLLGAPVEAASGPGWRLVLRPGWRIGNASRAGDRALEWIGSP